MGSFVYIFGEGDATAIQDVRSGRSPARFYKVGRALWGKRVVQPNKPLWPLEERFIKAQSCNPRRLGVIAAFEYPDDAAAKGAEAEYHRQWREVHGVRIWHQHEWYHGSEHASARPWQHAESVFTASGGVRVPDCLYGIPNRGGYEEGACETDRAGENFPLNLYVMQLEDEGSWFRVLATSYPNASNSAKGPHRWYNTGNPREISLARAVTAQSARNVLDVNDACHRIMSDLKDLYGRLQVPHSCMPGASWNTLAWFSAPAVPLLQCFDDVVAKHWDDFRAVDA